MKNHRSQKMFPAAHKGSLFTPPAQDGQDQISYGSGTPAKDRRGKYSASTANFRKVLKTKTMGI